MEEVEQFKIELVILQTLEKVYLKECSNLLYEKHIRKDLSLNEMEM